MNEVIHPIDESCIALSWKIPKMSISTIYFHASTRLVLGIFILYSTMMSLGTTMKIDPDGGYTDLVVRISSDGSVPENNCPKILYNLKVSS